MMDEIPLRDIHLPDPGLWWPPALGWWILLVVVTLGLLCLPRLLRWWRLKPVKKLSMRQLTCIRRELEVSGDEQLALQNISVLLRRIVMSYRGRTASASLSGEDWVHELERLAGENSFNKQQCEWLSNGQYQPASQCEIWPMIDSCEYWIRALPRRYDDAAV